MRKNFYVVLLIKYDEMQKMTQKLIQINEKNVPRNSVTQMNPTHNLALYLNTPVRVSGEEETSRSRAHATRTITFINTISHDLTAVY